MMRDQIRRMRKVLKRLGHTTNENVIDVKGRVACEVNTADELVVTELMFSGAFNDLSVEQVAAMLSCLVFQERRKEEGAPQLNEALAGPYRLVQVSSLTSTILHPSRLLATIRKHSNSLTHMHTNPMTGSCPFSCKDLYRGQARAGC